AKSRAEPTGRWGEATGKLLQEVPNAYLRVAVHEIGHAMDLAHNTKDNGFMNTTDAIADASKELQEKAKVAHEIAREVKFSADVATAASHVRPLLKAAKQAQEIYREAGLHSTAPLARSHLEAPISEPDLG